MKNITESTDNAEAELPEETPEQHREKIVLHLLENAHKEKWTNSAQENKISVLSVMTNLAIEIEMSIKIQGGKNEATDIKVFKDLGVERKDPDTPYRVAVNEIVGANLAGRPYAPRQVKAFIRTYMALYSAGFSSVIELTNFNTLRRNTGDVSTGSQSRTLIHDKI